MTTNKMPSASFRSKTNRDSYLQGVKRAGHDATVPGHTTWRPTTPTPTFRGSTTPRDSHTKASVPLNDVSYNPPSDFDTQRRTSCPANAAFRGRSSDRHSYMKENLSKHSGVPAYSVPGLAESLKSKPGAEGRFKGSSDRHSYMKELKGRFGDSSANVPGIAEQSARRATTPSAAFRGRPGTGRDSYMRELAGRTFAPAPNVPGIADEVARKSTGKFLGGNGKRDSHLAGAKHLNDVSYTVPGMAQKPDSVIASGSAFKGKGDRYSYMKEYQQRSGPTNASYNVPGIAEQTTPGRSTGLPCPANSSFRGQGSRDQYILLSPRTHDLSYDLPGMADEVARSPHGKFNLHSPSERDSHIRAEHKFVDAVYHIPGMAELNGSFASSVGMTNANRSLLSQSSGMTPRRH